MCPSTPVIEPQVAVDRLENVDWSFHPSPDLPKNLLQPFDVRRHHWYPGTFVPELPFSLIEILSKPGAKVLDPFGGIGTTYYQAMILNRYPVSVDICSIAIDFCRNLFTLFDPEADLNECKNEVSRIIGDYSQSTDYEPFLPDHVLIEELKPWYHPDVFNKLSYIYLQKGTTGSKYNRAAIEAVFSSMLATHSAQDRGWGYIADNVKPKEENFEPKQTLEDFESRLCNLVSDIQSVMKNTDTDFPNVYNSISPEDSILHMDIKDSGLGIEDNSIDLIVTSPPYPEMTDYTASQRLSYYWKGRRVGLSETQSDLSDEIGARRKRFRQQSTSDYLADMKDANTQISNKLRKDGYLCVVLPVIDGEKDERGEIVNSVVSDLQSKPELVKVTEQYRNLPSNERAHNVAWTSVSQERIDLFRKVT